MKKQFITFFQSSWEDRWKGDFELLFPLIWNESNFLWRFDTLLKSVSRLWIVYAGLILMESSCRVWLWYSQRVPVCPDLLPTFRPRLYLQLSLTSFIQDFFFFNVICSSTDLETCRHTLAVVQHDCVISGYPSPAEPTLAPQRGGTAWWSGRKRWEFVEFWVMG